MGILNAKAILDAADMPFEDFEVPEWGGAVRLRLLSCKDRDDVAEKAKKNPAGLGPLLFVKCAIDEDGKPLYPEAQATFISATKSAVVMDRVVAKIMAMNGMSPEAAKENLGKADAGSGTTD